MTCPVRFDSTEPCRLVGSQEQDNELKKFPDPNPWIITPQRLLALQGDFAKLPKP